MYDAIVVGARCAGSTTAMLLARKGYRVLLVDRASFPSDTVSCHYIHQPGVASLKKWGLLGRVRASGCPPVERQIFDPGAFSLAGTPPPADGVTAGYAPRRTVLDKILVDAAAESGVEVRERFSVQDLIRQDDRVAGIRGRSRNGAAASEKARIVIGADGMRSTIARLVAAPVYDEAPAYSCAYYTYWGDVPVDSVELYPRPGRTIVAAPTNHGLTMTIVYWPQSEFDEVRSNIEQHFMRALELAPGLAGRVRAGRRAERFRGSGDLRNFFRKPYGPGWALAGDAAYHKNPITAEGMTDAFRDAESLADAIDDAFAGKQSLEDALARHESRRNETVMPLYRLTCELARLEPPSADMQKLLAALRGNQEQIGRFLGTIAGTVPISDFFSEQNVSQIFAAAAAD